MSITDFPKGRYIVTGGAGFIGSHLCERLLNLGCEVVAVDNFITGKRENVAELHKNSGFSLMEQDISTTFEVGGTAKGIFHMASPASPVDYAKYPIETLRVGAHGSDRILEFAKHQNCRVLVASTSEIYGDPLQHPQKETYWGNVNPIGPRGCYDESKRYLEAITMAYNRTENVQTRIIRIFNTYGPRMRTDDGRVVPNFCMQALRGEPVTVYGDGSQTRSFCYVDDLVDGILRTYLSDRSLPINLGNPVEYSILQFAKKIIELTNSKSEITYKDLPVDDPKVRCPDISTAKESLKWSPSTDLKTGLEKTIKYFSDFA